VLIRNITISRGGKQLHLPVTVNGNSGFNAFRVVIEISYVKRVSFLNLSVSEHISLFESLIIQRSVYVYECSVLSAGLTSGVICATVTLLEGTAVKRKYNAL
jgi:hypothetical protein